MIGAKTILRGSLRFFATGTFLYMVGVIPIMLSGGTGIDPRAPLKILLYTVSATAGFAAVLSGLRRYLGDGAPIAGRQSIVAGVVTPIAIIIGLKFGPHPAVLAASAAICAGVGAALALGMFFPWLSRSGSAQARLVAEGSASPAIPSTPFDAQSKTYSRSHVRSDDGSGA